MDRKLLLGDRVRKTTIMKKKMSVDKIDPKTLPVSESDTLNINFHQNKSENLSEVKNQNYLNDHTSITCTSNNSNNINSLVFLEEVPLNFYDEVEIPSESEINNDYLIDLTEDELRFRSDKEENFLMKEYCNFFLI
jgi:hypothetical protein